MNFWLWFKFVIIFQNETLNMQGTYTLLKIHIYSIMINTKNVMYLGNYKLFFLDKMQKISSKNSHVWKKYFGAKGHVILVYTNTIGSIYLVWNLKDYFAFGKGLLKRHYKMICTLFLWILNRVFEYYGFFLCNIQIV